MLLGRSTATWLLIGFSNLYASISAESAQELLLAHHDLSNDTLLWGPYRPNLYFGVRPRLARSLLTGLIWGNVDDYQAAQLNFRHTCEQSDNMAGYGWEEYDARTGGREVIHDTSNKIDLTIDYVKIPGGKHGGSWGAKIKGTLREGAAPNTVTSVIFYATMDGLGELSVANEHSSSRYQEPVIIHGDTADLGEFDIEVTVGKGKVPYKIHDSWDEKPLDGALVASIKAPPEQLWRAKEIMFTSMKQTVDGYVQQYGQESMPPPWQAFTIHHDPGEANMHMIQKVLVGDFEFDIIFKSGSAKEEITSELLEQKIASTSIGFKEKFKRIFKNQVPFIETTYGACAESMFSNLLGGIGYFYGDSVVDRSYAEEYDEENEGFWEETAAARARGQYTQEPPHELFTSVPSRPFFPRGFLWDEGFHLVPIIEWDTDLALQIVDSWFNLIDSEGWIAREQILGAEARSKVPMEFQVQYPHYANPPTLFLTVDTLVEKVKSGKLPADQEARLRDKLATMYPLLERQYNWFRRTQNGDIKSYEREAFSAREAYRWRGRTPQHILPSGLDDYPRAQPPHPGELHLDLISWMGFLSRSLVNLATLLGESEDTTKYSTQHQAILRNIDDLHWSKKDQTYCDATIDDYEEHMLVCHKGYISLFPFMTQLLPSTHPNIPAILNLISSPDHLWSPYGIRSLSKSDEFYGTAENYWRSPIWMNMNWLILRSLLAVATDPKAPPAVKTQSTEIYSDLRTNLVENVVKQWQDTGFAWEQYNPETGKGQRTQHFTGWTSLVVTIMTMPDLSGGAGAGVKHGEL